MYNERPWGNGQGRIQWKGTDVCMDVLCVCGNGGHVDGDFVYYLHCPKCGRYLAVDPVVQLVEVPEDEESTWNPYEIVDPCL